MEEKAPYKFAYTFDTQYVEVVESDGTRILFARDKDARIGYFHLVPPEVQAWLEQAPIHVDVPVIDLRFRAAI